MYVLAEINANDRQLLLDFQQRMALMAQFLGQAPDDPPGELFNRWRGFRNAKRSEDTPFRFVDGELIERFLDLDEVRQEAVIEGLGPSVEAMRNMVEELRRMH